MPENDQPVFDEVQVSRILRRTAELQAGRPDEPTAGLTLEELRDLAAEVGLDPELVAAAVAEIQSDAEHEGSSWWGGPTSFVAEQDLPFGVDDALWERMLLRIRSTLGGTGTVDVRGTTREWTHDSKDGYMAQVTATTDGKRTHVRIFQSAPIAATLLYIFSSIIGFISFLVLLFEAGPLIGIPVWLAGVSALFFAVRWLVGRSSDANRRATSSLMSELAATGVSESSARTDRNTRRDSTLRIPLPEDEHLPDSELTRRRNRAVE